MNLHRSARAGTIFALLTALALLAPAASAHPEVTDDPAHDDASIHRPVDRDQSAAMATHDELVDELDDVVDSWRRDRRIVRDLSVFGRGERLVPNATTDVWEHDRYAYIGTFNSPCGTGDGRGGGDLVGDVEDPGVPVFSVRNPTRPRYVGNIPSVEGSRVNDVKVAELNYGDILVHSNEACDGGPGGFEIYDVDRPTSPELLASVRIDEMNETLQDPELFGPITDVGVHNLFLFTQDDRDYVAAVAGTVFDNFVIYDITDPTAPQRVGSWGAEELSDPGVGDSDDVDRVQAAVGYLLSGFGNSQNRFLHDITITEDGTKAYLSNWDAGLVLLDISDPSEPEFVSQALNAEEGSLDGEVNSHNAWPNEDGSVVVETEEDFSAIVTTTPPGNLTFGDLETNTIPGVAVSTFAGDEFEANPTGNVAVVDDSAVTVQEGPLEGQNFEAIELAGSQPVFAEVGSVTGAAVFVGQACDGDELQNAGLLTEDGMEIAVARRGVCPFSEKLANVAAAGADAVVIANNQRTDTPWGGVRIWDYSDPENPVLASTFYTTCAADPDAPECDPRGTYTVHNVQVEDDKAYISWYTDGVRILDISDPYNPEETAIFDESGEEFEESNGGIQDVWGVYKGDRPWVYASDRNGGLYVLLTLGVRDLGRP